MFIRPTPFSCLTSANRGSWALWPTRVINAPRCRRLSSNYNADAESYEYWAELYSDLASRNFDLHDHVAIFTLGPPRAGESHANIMYRELVSRGQFIPTVTPLLKISV